MASDTAPCTLSGARLTGVHAGPALSHVARLLARVHAAREFPAARQRARVLQQDTALLAAPVTAAAPLLQTKHTPRSQARTGQTRLSPKLGIAG